MTAPTMSGTTRTTAGMHWLRSPLAALAASLLGAWLVLCAYLYWQQRALIYFPHYTRVDPALTDFAIERDGITLRGWVANPGAGDPLLYFGGNAERVEITRRGLAELFPRRTVYVLAYRGYGASEGEPSADALVADAVALYDHVRARHPGRPVAAIGRSLGSGVASQLAARRAIERLALITPFDDLATPARDRFPIVPVRWLLRERFDSAAALRGFRRPVLVVQAGRDQVIPAHSTQALIAALPIPPRHVEIDSADHNDIDAHDRYAQALREFFR